MYWLVGKFWRAATIACCVSLANPAAGQSADGNWWTIDRDLAGSRFSPLTEINRDNVAGLVESWRFETGSNSTAVPLAIDGTV
ncbi:MAG: hypothetical protein PVH89_10755, partial [Gammaproteobacteria bacterium]